MGNWPALLLAPSLALANLAITYALTTPSCSRQSQLPQNLVTAAILVICVVFTLQAWRNWIGKGGGAEAVPGDAASLRGRFVALVAGMVGALSCLVVIAQWFPQWTLSPCAS
ncbi:MAG: hypothetical protein ACJ8LG_20140 [Massilia sp.]